MNFFRLRPHWKAKRIEQSAKRHRAKRKGLSLRPKNLFLMALSLFLALCSMLLAPCYFMTLSARASTFGVIVRPICFAVFRLMTSSNFVGCSTGRSAGLVPFRILST